MRITPWLAAAGIELGRENAPTNFEMLPIVIVNFEFFALAPLKILCFT